MGSKLFRIGLGMGLAVFMGVATVLGGMATLPVVFTAKAETQQSVSTGAAVGSEAVEAVKEIIPRADDKVIYTTVQGLQVKKQDATLYMTINGIQYEVIGQGDGTDMSSTVAGYADLEYLEATGTQYIATGFTPNNNTKIEATMAVRTVKADSFMVFFCDKGSAASSSFSCFLDSATKMLVRYGSVERQFSAPAANTKYIFTLNKNVFTWQNSSYSTIASTTFSTQTFTSVEVRIFAQHRSGSAVTCTPGILYSYKIWNNGTLVRDFLPVKRKSDNVLGLYDKVNSTFYTNVGSGTFTAGPSLAPDWADASTYDDNSPAAGAIAGDANVATRTLQGIDSVGGAPVGYLVVKNGSNYLKVRI